MAGLGGEGTRDVLSTAKGVPQGVSDTGGGAWQWQWVALQVAEGLI